MSKIVQNCIRVWYGSTQVFAHVHGVRVTARILLLPAFVSRTHWTTARILYLTANVFPVRIGLHFASFVWPHLIPVASERQNKARKATHEPCTPICGVCMKNQCQTERNILAPTWVTANARKLGVLNSSIVSQSPTVGDRLSAGWGILRFWAWYKYTLHRYTNVGTLFSQ